MPINVDSRRTSALLRSYSTSPPEATLKITSIAAPHAGSIKILSLNRPQARNAISAQLLGELGREIHSIAQEDAKTGSTRAVIIASESDDAFCAGADLKERLTFTPEETKHFLTTLRNTFSALSTLPIPTISAISSTAFGGGLELALCTTFRVFASTATVGLPETRLAIIPGAGGTYRLPALIGTSRARDLILTGRPVSAPEGYFTGLCDRLVELPVSDPSGLSAEQLKDHKVAARKQTLEAAVALANDVCAGGPVATRAALEAVNMWGAGDEAENKAYEKVFVTEDRMEALRAFADKRRPAFKGR
ncbi:hypothetical protein AAFC00_006676 [Neodothiora populina]|uniref:Enoyl-CoA hydratase n=1 Tax=Neodothiora populina TaxID=2781224 RepID=A0ABR3PBH8_9PEZI